MMIRRKESGNFFAERKKPMKKLTLFRATVFLFVALISFPILGFAGEEQAGSSKAKASEKNFSQTVKEKYHDEMDAVKKDTSEAGREIKKSYTDLPGKAGEDFKETGTALKDAGKEIKEGTAESWQNLKNLFKKK
jgi:hypothetical protein